MLWKKLIICFKNARINGKIQKIKIIKTILTFLANKMLKFLRKIYRKFKDNLKNSLLID